MKDSDRILRHLSGALETWRDEDLLKLAELLSDTQWRAQAVRQLRTLGGQNARAVQHALTTLDQPGSRRKSRPRTGAARFAGKDAEREFMEFVCDSNRFPSITTLLGVLGAAWGPIYGPDDFKGCRRRDLARRLWRDLSKLSQERREDRLKKLAATTEFRDANAYIELFKKIVEK